MNMEQVCQSTSLCLLVGSYPFTRSHINHNNLYTTMIKFVSALDIKDTNHNIKSNLIYNFNLYINSCYFMGTQHNLSAPSYVRE
jgi:hypothetical protein